MNSLISNRELDELGDGLVRHYLAHSGMQATARCIDIEGLANFLGLTVTYETFAEKDFDKIGFLSDGKTPLLVRRGGRVVSFLFPLGTIVLDVSLHADKESGRCRFTIAHEIAHFMIDQHRPAAQYHRTFDAEKKYSVAEMNELFNIVENQADRLAAAILMPRFMVKDPCLRTEHHCPEGGQGHQPHGRPDRSLLQRHADPAPAVRAVGLPSGG